MIQVHAIPQSRSFIVIHFVGVSKIIHSDACTWYSSVMIIYRYTFKFCSSFKIIHSGLCTWWTSAKIIQSDTCSWCSSVKISHVTHVAVVSQSRHKYKAESMTNLFTLWRYWGLIESLAKCLGEFKYYIIALGGVGGLTPIDDSDDVVRSWTKMMKY